MARTPKHPSWQIQRTTQEHPQALLRWDQAYRRLLEWSVQPGAPTGKAAHSATPVGESNAPPNPASATPGAGVQEGPHE